MKRFSIDHILGAKDTFPFWKPWGLGSWTGKSFLFLVLLLCFLALFCLPGRLRWLLWILLLLSLLLLLLKATRRNAPRPHTGDVQILLEWETRDDLDLHVVDPSGEEIYFDNKHSASGGELDIDANASPANMMRHPKENVYWRHGGAPAGQYKVYVKLYCLRGSLPVPFKVMAKYGREVMHFDGIVEEDGSTVPVCTFYMNRQ